ncbi:MAG: hypothetical protein R3C24_03610 [Cyanobacteriota/Melainabacteria group bacterium]
MDLSNLRKSKKDKDSPAARLNQSDNSNQDAAPGQKSPKNIMETDTWKKSKSGISSLWKNYLDILGKYFRNYRRPEQERLITTMCTVITIGCATVLVTLFILSSRSSSVFSLCLPSWSAPGSLPPKWYRQSSSLRWKTD